MAKKHKVKKVNEPAAENAATPGTAVALPGGKALALPAGIKVTKRITLPSLTIKENQRRFLHLVDQMRISQVKQKPAADGTTPKPATVCTAGDVETGEMFIFIVPAVVMENLQRDYPEHSYVGKSFMIWNKGKRKEGQRYNDFEIAEVDVSELTASAAAQQDAA